MCVCVCVFLGGVGLKKKGKKTSTEKNKGVNFYMVTVLRHMFLICVLQNSGLFVAKHACWFGYVFIAKYACWVGCHVCYRLLSYAAASDAPLPTSETLLNNEIQWLKKVRVRQSSTPLLWGYLLSEDLNCLSKLDIWSFMAMSQLEWNHRHIVASVTVISSWQSCYGFSYCPIVASFTVILWLQLPHHCSFWVCLLYLFCKMRVGE